mmetsp:Transcript_11265/g.28891  ORF Transcript_11265/g.28891 Transcript_11265/m.28891 type:complete len:438 (+) Transcript_11265:144-1457(+)
MRGPTVWGTPRPDSGPLPPPTLRHALPAICKRKLWNVRRLQGLHDSAGGLDGPLNVSLSVLQRGEASLVLGGREVHTLLQHTAVPPAKLLGVRRGGLLKARHGALAEEEAEHAADGAAAHGVPSLPASLQDALDQGLGDLVQVLVGTGLAQDLQGLNASGHGQGVSGQGAGLVHGARGRNHLHDVAAAAVRANREATADDLAHGSQVGGHSEVLLGAALGDAEAGHNLVEAQQGALLLGHVTQTLQELLGRGDKAGVADNGLQDHAGNLALVGLKQRLHALKVVVGGAQGAGGRALGDAGAVGQAEGGHAGASLHQEGVGMAVVAADELDDLLALGVGAHETQHRQAGLRARVHKAHHLHRRHTVDNHLAQDVLQLAGSTEAGALRDLGNQGLVDLVAGVAADSRAPGADVVDVLVAVHVKGIRSLDLVKHDGVAAH